MNDLKAAFLFGAFLFLSLTDCHIVRDKACPAAVTVFSTITVTHDMCQAAVEAATDKPVAISAVTVTVTSTYTTALTDNLSYGGLDVLAAAVNDCAYSICCLTWGGRAPGCWCSALNGQCSNCCDNDKGINCCGFTGSGKCSQ